MTATGGSWTGLKVGSTYSRRRPCFLTTNTRNYACEFVPYRKILGSPNPRIEDSSGIEDSLGALEAALVMMKPHERLDLHAVGLVFLEEVGSGKMQLQAEEPKDRPHHLGPGRIWTGTWLQVSEGAEPAHTPNPGFRLLEL